MAAAVEIDTSRFFPNNLPDDQSRTDLVHGDGRLTSKCRGRLDSSIRALLGKLESRIAAADYTDPDTSVFTGRAGHAFLYLHLALLCSDDEAGRKARGDHLDKALVHLSPCLEGLRGKRISFLCGDPGPLALAAAIAHQRGNDAKVHVAQLLKIAPTAAKKDFPDELLYGRAGYLYSLLFVRHHCGGESAVSNSHVREVAKSILESGKAFSKSVGAKSPLWFEWHEKQYLGAGHGVAGILHVLLQAKEFLTPEELSRLVKPSIDSLASMRFASGNFPSSVGSQSDKLVQWCHGSPGVVHLYLKASQVFPNDAPSYISIAKKCGDVTWERGLLKKGYGLCHGAAGNAYAFLGLYELTADVTHLHRALQFADWCCGFDSRSLAFSPDKPLSLMNGWAGTILFLSDVRRKKVKFPTLEI